eukprot:Hpha_TRINITY_DN3184_c0_g1::TRINITY_DN3184_c0_g1_i1::g.96508::m.96508
MALFDDPTQDLHALESGLLESLQRLEDEVAFAEAGGWSQPPPPQPTAIRESLAVPEGEVPGHTWNGQPFRVLADLQGIGEVRPEVPAAHRGQGPVPEAQVCGQRRGGGGGASTVPSIDQRHPPSRMSLLQHQRRV